MKCIYSPIRRNARNSETQALSTVERKSSSGVRKSIKEEESKEEDRQGVDAEKKKEKKKEG